MKISCSIEDRYSEDIYKGNEKDPEDPKCYRPLTFVSGSGKGVRKGDQ